MLKCLYCNKQLTGNQRKFCSKNCSNLFRSVKPDGSRPAPRRERLSHCEVCDKPLIGRQIRYCSISCKSNALDYMLAKNRGLTRKQTLVAQFGGACQQCGYNANLTALSFHHRDESTKLFGITMRAMSTRTWKKVLAEAKKCELFCANCHMAHHSPDLTMTNLRNHPPQLPIDKQYTKGCCISCDTPLTGNKTKFCSNACKNAYHQDYARQRQRGIVRKMAFIDQLGGKCADCGYDDNLASLNFHHVDADKEYKLDLRSLGNRSLKAVTAEIEKCELLCANCHMERHHPTMLSVYEGDPH